VKDGDCHCCDFRKNLSLLPPYFPEVTGVVEQAHEAQNPDISGNVNHLGFRHERNQYDSGSATK
jgi:hypothetical protein